MGRRPTQDRSKRVCVVARSLLPYDTRCTQQITALLQRGYACDVLCLGAAGEPRQQKAGGLSVWRLSRASTRKLSVLAYAAAVLSFAVKASAILVVLSTRHRYRAVVVHTLPEALVLVAWWCRLSGVPVILDARDLTVELMASRLNHPVHSLPGTILRLVERFCVRFSSHVLTASPGFGRALTARGTPHGKMTVIVNGADDSLFRFDRRPEIREITDAAMLVYHGTVSPRFGVLVAVEALAVVQSSIPRTELHVYGAYDMAYRELLERRAADLGIAHLLFLHPVMQLSQLSDIIGRFDLGVVPYLSDRFMNLALSTKTFEYIAAGLPVVASRLRSTAELFSDRAIEYAQPGDPFDLAEKISYMCLHPRIRSERRAEAFREYVRFSTVVRNETYLRVIEGRHA